jgi:hypothetical protein
MDDEDARHLAETLHILSEFALTSQNPKKSMHPLGLGRRRGPDA